MDEMKSNERPLTILSKYQNDEYTAVTGENSYREKNHDNNGNMIHQRKLSVDTHEYNGSSSDNIMVLSSNTEDHSHVVTPVNDNSNSNNSNISSVNVDRKDSSGIMKHHDSTATTNLSDDDLDQITNVLNYKTQMNNKHNKTPTHHTSNSDKSGYPHQHKHISSPFPPYRTSISNLHQSGSNKNTPLVNHRKVSLSNQSPSHAQDHSTSHSHDDEHHPHDATDSSPVQPHVRIASGNINDARVHGDDVDMSRGHIPETYDFQPTPRYPSDHRGGVSVELYNDLIDRYEHLQNELFDSKRQINVLRQSLHNTIHNNKSIQLQDRVTELENELLTVQASNKAFEKQIRKITHTADLEKQQAEDYPSVIGKLMEEIRVCKARHKMDEKKYYELDLRSRKQNEYLVTLEQRYRRLQQEYQNEKKAPSLKTTTSTAVLPTYHTAANSAQISTTTHTRTSNSKQHSSPLLSSSNSVPSLHHSSSKKSLSSSSLNRSSPPAQHVVSGNSNSNKSKHGSSNRSSYSVHGASGSMGVDTQRSTASNVSTISQRQVTKNSGSNKRAQSSSIKRYQPTDVHTHARINPHPKHRRSPSESSTAPFAAPGKRESVEHTYSSNVAAGTSKSMNPASPSSLSNYSPSNKNDNCKYNSRAAPPAAASSQVPVRKAPSTPLLSKIPSISPARSSTTMAAAPLDRDNTAAAEIGEAVKNVHTYPVSAESDSVPAANTINSHASAAQRHDAQSAPFNSLMNNNNGAKLNNPVYYQQEEAGAVQGTEIHTHGNAYPHVRESSISQHEPPLRLQHSLSPKQPRRASTYFESILYADKQEQAQPPGQPYTSNPNVTNPVEPVSRQASVHNAATAIHSRQTTIPQPYAGDTNDASNDACEEENQPEHIVHGQSSIPVASRSGSLRGSAPPHQSPYGEVDMPNNNGASWLQADREKEQKGDAAANGLSNDVPWIQSAAQQQPSQQGSEQSWIEAHPHADSQSQLQPHGQQYTAATNDGVSSSSIASGSLLVSSPSRGLEKSTTFNQQPTRHQPQPQPLNRSTTFASSTHAPSTAPAESAATHRDQHQSLSPHHSKQPSQMTREEYAMYGFQPSTMPSAKQSYDSSHSQSHTAQRGVHSGDVSGNGTARSKKSSYAGNVNGKGTARGDVTHETQNEVENSNPNVNDNNEYDDDFNQSNQWE